MRARALEALDAADLSDDADPLTAEGFVFDMVAQHEAQHTETVLQCLQMLPAGRYVPASRRALPAPAEAGGRLGRVPAATFAMGRRRAASPTTASGRPPARGGGPS